MTLATASASPSFGMMNVLTSLAPSGHKRALRPDELIHDMESPADSVYLVLSGEVRILQPGPLGTPRLVEILGQNDWFGVSALAGISRCENIAVAMTAASVLEMPVNLVFGALKENPELSYQLVRQLSERLHSTGRQVSRFAFDDCEQRVLNTLLEFSRTAAASAVNEKDVSLRITHQQLAQAIGVARETVSLTLTKLRRRNLVQTGRNRLVFNPDALAHFLQEKR